MATLKYEIWEREGVIERNTIKIIGRILYYIVVRNGSSMLTSLAAKASVKLYDAFAVSIFINGYNSKRS